MKILRLLVGIGGGSMLLATAFAAQAGSLSPALAQLEAAYSHAPAAVVKSLAMRPGVQPSVFGPRVSAAGAVQVYIHYQLGERPAPAALDMLGATRIRAALGVVQAWVPISRLRQLAGLSGVTRVGLPAYAIVRGPSGSQPRADTCSAVASGLAIDSQGITVENIQPVQAAGVTGSGVKVGIISTGVTCMASSQTAGYLPSNIYVNSSLPGSGDEGTAMLEEVHAVAPGATLGFCGPNTSVDFVTCYNDFANWGANIIADDLGFPVSFFFNDPDAMSFTLGIQLFAQSNPDISLVTAAGNDRQDYYQVVYTPSAGTSPIGLTPTGYTPETGGTTGRTYQSIMDIGGDPYEIVHVRASFSSAQPTYFLLTWNDPIKGPYDDLDLYLVNQTTGKILDASTYDQASDVNYAPSSASWNPPEEFVQYSGGPQALELVVMCYQCNQTQNLLVKLTGTLDGAGNFVHKADGGVYGQAAMVEEISVAAAHVTSGTNAAMENFSQTGPYIGGDWLHGTISVPKPDITGIDGVTVSGAGGFGSPFYGTSAASPNVASVLALLRSAFPSSSYTAAQWKQLVESNANIASLGSPPPASSEAGAGLIDAHASVASLDGGMITTKITAPGSSSLTVVAPASVQFDASCTYGGSESLNYSWNFGDSSIPASNQLHPAAVTYNKAGTYVARFSCSDRVQSASSQVQVTVKPAPSSGGGGGAFGLGGLAGLLAVAGLLALRRRR